MIAAGTVVVMQAKRAAAVMQRGTAVYPASTGTGRSTTDCVEELRLCHRVVRLEQAEPFPLSARQRRPHQAITAPRRRSTTAAGGGKRSFRLFLMMFRRMLAPPWHLALNCGHGPRLDNRKFLRSLLSSKRQRLNMQKPPQQRQRQRQRQKQREGDPVAALAHAAVSFHVRNSE